MHLITMDILYIVNSSQVVIGRLEEGNTASHTLVMNLFLELTFPTNLPQPGPQVLKIMYSFICAIDM